MPERHVNPYETHIPTHKGFEWCAVFVPRAYYKVIRANNVAIRGEIAQQAEWIVREGPKGGGETRGERHSVDERWNNERRDAKLPGTSGGSPRGARLRRFIRKGWYK